MNKTFSFLGYVCVGGVVAALVVFFGGAGFPKHTPPRKHSAAARTGADLPLAEQRTFWIGRVRETGGVQAYKEFHAVFDRESFDVSHGAAHVFGEALYEGENISGVAACDASFGFGCYHGFFSRAFTEEGEEVIAALDLLCVEKFGPLGTGCQHGIGHGIAEYMRHGDIAAALGFCKQTTQLKKLFGCSSGVFMEYNSPTIFSGGTVIKTVRAFDELHPYEPCMTTVPEQHRESCFYELPAWWTTVLQNDFAHIGALCVSLPASRYRDACLLGVGNIAAPTARYEVAGSADICGRMPDEESRAVCLAGASWSFFADPRERSKADAVCNVLQNAAQVSACIKRSDLIGNGERLLQ